MGLIGGNSGASGQIFIPNGGILPSPSNGATHISASGSLLTGGLSAAAWNAQTAQRLYLAQRFHGSHNSLDYNAAASNLDAISNQQWEEIASNRSAPLSAGQQLKAQQQKMVYLTMAQYAAFGPSAVAAEQQRQLNALDAISDQEWEAIAASNAAQQLTNYNQRQADLYRQTTLLLVNRLYPSQNADWRIAYDRVTAITPEAWLEIVGSQGGGGLTPLGNEVKQSAIASLNNLYKGKQSDPAYKSELDRINGISASTWNSNAQNVMQRPKSTGYPALPRRGKFDAKRGLTQSADNLFKIAGLSAGFKIQSKGTDDNALAAIRQAINGTKKDGGGILPTTEKINWSAKPSASAQSKSATPSPLPSPTTAPLTSRPVLPGNAAQTAAPVPPASTGNAPMSGIRPSTSGQRSPSSTIPSLPPVSAVGATLPSVRGVITRAPLPPGGVIRQPLVTANTGPMGGGFGPMGGSAVRNVSATWVPQIDPKPKVVGVTLRPAGYKEKQPEKPLPLPPPATPQVSQQKATFLRLDPVTGKPVVLVNGQELFTTFTIGTTGVAPGQTVLVTTTNGQTVMEVPDKAPQQQKKPQAAQHLGPTVPEALASIVIPAPWMQSITPPVVTYSSTSIPDPETSFSPGTFLNSMTATVPSQNGEASVTVTLYQDIKNDQRPSWAPELMASLAEEGSGSSLGQNILRQTSYFADPILDPDGPGGILPPYLEDGDAPSLSTTKQWERHVLASQQKAFWKPVGGGRSMVVIAASVSTLFTSRTETRSQSLSSAYYVDPAENCVGGGFFRNYNSTGSLGYEGQSKTFNQSFSYYGFIVGWDGVEQVPVDAPTQDALRDCLDTYALGGDVPLWSSHEHVRSGWTANPFPTCGHSPSSASSGPGPSDFYFPIIESTGTGGGSVPGYSPL